MTHPPLNCYGYSQESSLALLLVLIPQKTSCKEEEEEGRPQCPASTTTVQVSVRCVDMCTGRAPLYLGKINILRNNKIKEGYCISKKHSFLKELAIFKVKRLILVQQTFKEHQLLEINIITCVQVDSFALPWLMSTSWPTHSDVELIQLATKPASTLGTRLHSGSCTAQIYPIRFFFLIVLKQTWLPHQYLSIPTTQETNCKKTFPRDSRSFSFWQFFFWMILMKMAAHSRFMSFTIKRQERK